MILVLLFCTWLLWIALQLIARRAIPIALAIAAAWFTADQGATAAIAAALAVLALGAFLLDEFAQRTSLALATVIVESVSGASILAMAGFTLLTWKGASSTQAAGAALALAVVASLVPLQFRLNR